MDSDIYLRKRFSTGLFLKPDKVRLMSGERRRNRLWYSGRILYRFKGEMIS